MAKKGFGQKQYFNILATQNKKIIIKSSRFSGPWQGR
jgi:hypothetical protein